jgi:hypothetical protein
LRVSPLVIIRSLFALILISNIYAYFYAVSMGYLEADYNNYIIRDLGNLHLSIAVVLVYLVIFYWVFSISTRLRVRKSKEFIGYTRSSELFFGFGVLIYQLSFLIFNIVEGVNYAGQSGSTTSNPINYLFLLLRPDYIAVVYLACFGNGFVYKTNLVVYIFSMLSRGWLGFVFLLFLIAILRKNFTLKRLFISKYFLVGCFVLTFLGVILSVRNQYRVGGVGAISMDQVGFGVEYLKFGFHALMMRFQQVYTLVYFFENQEYFRNLVELNKILPVFAEGAGPKFIFDVITNDDAKTMGRWLALHSRDLGSDRSTAFTPGLITHLLSTTSLVATLIYIILIPIISGTLVGVVGRNTAFHFVAFYFLLFLYTTGWANAFFNAFLVIAFFAFVHMFVLKKR